MDGNTRYSRTFRVSQDTIDALTRIAEIQTARAIAAGKDPDKARCTLTDALELAVARWNLAEARTDRVPEPGELRVMAKCLGDMAEAMETEEAPV